jgi:hypothetical protein
MVEILYGLTRADEQEYIKLLSNVVTLPAIVTLAKFAQAGIVDGVSDDRRSEQVPGEEVEEKYPEASAPAEPVRWCPTCQAATPTTCVCVPDSGVVQAALGSRFLAALKGRLGRLAEYSVLGTCDESDSHGVAPMPICGD